MGRGRGTRAKVAAARRSALPLDQWEAARRLARSRVDAPGEGAARDRAVPAYPGRVTGNELQGWRVEEFGCSRDGVPMRVFLPHGDGPIAGLLTAAQHGEEADTALMARRLLERIPADETRWAVVPVLNPDGLLNGTRQNAAGVDLNRNFPASTWGPEPSPTYPPGIAPELRVSRNRTNMSSPGTHPGSEPETRAQMALVECLAPALVIDLHTPLDLILVRGNAPADVVDALADGGGHGGALRPRQPLSRRVRRLAHRA